MSSSFERFQKRRLITSYFSVIISIGLVLFLLGLLGIIVLNTKKAAEYFKEQIPLTIYLDDTAKDAEVDQLRKSLELADYIKSVNFVSKDEAAQKQIKDMGEDFIEFLGHNPLRNSIDVHFLAEYVTSEKVAEISDDLKAKAFVEEVDYDEPLIAIVNKNVQRISFWMLVASGVFLLIAILLINSSIRLSVYSKRFTIKTMQMVGATKRFIRRPFINHSMQLGLAGSLLALAGMGGVLYYIDKTFPDLGMMDDKGIVIGIFAGVFVLGLLLSWLSTYFATQRFLNLQTDELYY